MSHPLVSTPAILLHYNSHLYANLFFDLIGTVNNTNFFLLSAGKDCITRLLDKNESTRLGSRSGASEVKQHKWFAKLNWGLLRNGKPPVSIAFWRFIGVIFGFPKVQAMFDQVVGIFHDDLSSSSLL